MSDEYGTLVVLAGKSATGKTALYSMFPRGMQIDTYTTRPWRGEDDYGVFVSRETFIQLRDRGDLICVKEFPASGTSEETWFYGIHRSDLPLKDQTRVVVLDPEGAEEISKIVSDTKIFYLTAPDHVRLERMHERGDDYDSAMLRWGADDRQFFFMHSSMAEVRSASRKLMDRKLEGIKKNGDPYCNGKVVFTNAASYESGSFSSASPLIVTTRSFSQGWPLLEVVSEEEFDKRAEDLLFVREMDLGVETIKYGVSIPDLPFTGTSAKIYIDEEGIEFVRKNPSRFPDHSILIKPEEKDEKAIVDEFEKSLLKEEHSVMSAGEKYIAFTEYIGLGANGFEYRYALDGPVVQHVRKLYDDFINAD